MEDELILKHLKAWRHHTDQGNALYDVPRKRGEARYHFTAADIEARKAMNRLEKLIQESKP